MPRILAIVFCFILAVPAAKASFAPLTAEQRVAASSVIAVIKVTKVHQMPQSAGNSYSEAIVLDGLWGTRARDQIKIWDNIQTDKDGKEYLIAGRDPYLEVGKTYFVYLVENKQGKLITVQSSLDSLLVTGSNVKKEGGDGVEPLETKIKRTRDLIAKLKKAGAIRGDGEKPSN